MSNSSLFSTKVKSTQGNSSSGGSKTGQGKRGGVMFDDDIDDEEFDCAVPQRKRKR